MKLSQRLRSERERRGWSQVYVAKKIGITNSAFSNYEQGIRVPDLETLSKLAELYECSLDYLTGRTDIREPAAETGTNEKLLVRDKSGTYTVLPDEYSELKDYLFEADAHIFFKEFMGASKKHREETINFLRFILEKEKNRKPGQQQE